MKAAMKYRALLGFLTPLFTYALPQPAGSIVLWGVFAVQLAWAATLIRKRTHLFFSSLAMAMGSAVSVMAVALLVAGYELIMLPMPWAAVYWLGVVAVPVTLYVDMFARPDEWEAWKRHMDDATLRDMLRGRHIPDLRREMGFIEPSGQWS